MRPTIKHIGKPTLLGDLHQCRWRSKRSAILRDPQFQAVPELVKALEQLDEERFPKLMAYLKNPEMERVRTNNHVERTNRSFRFLEKVRDKWRQRQSVVRFIVLTLDEVWSRWTPAINKKGKTKNANRKGKTQPQTG